MATAAAARQPLPTWFAQNRVVGAAQLAAANAVEFGMPLFDVSTFDASQNAMSLVSEELLRKHNVLPLSTPIWWWNRSWWMKTRSAARWSNGMPATKRSVTRWAATTRAWETWM
ncbi:hypothetical protein G6F68_019110 [Rhizopus microsporus]|nr:hypothetical protein G6F68_019110 [Rhizopus microsporus]